MKTAPGKPIVMFLIVAICVGQMGSLICLRGFTGAW
jgi:hypothetical protein